MSHVLDRPVWQTMNGFHAELAHGTLRAKRFSPDVSAFAALQDEDEKSLLELADLVAPGEMVALVQASPVSLPVGMREVGSGALVQLTTSTMPSALRDDDIEELGWADAQAMLALADVARPGPLTLNALKLGRFWGIKRDGQLVAMAGQRMRVPGYTEISGICTHPDYQGQGLARRLSVLAMRVSMADGDKAFLHSFPDNAAALHLYHALGFVERNMMQMKRFEKLRLDEIAV